MTGQYPTLSGIQTTLKQGDSGFPQLCLNLEPALASLNVLGDATQLNHPAIAIVGARKATPYGLSCARHFAQLAAERGILVVSGGAIGCDQAAHRGALEAGGKTVAVLGCAANVVYPRRAKELFSEILDSGGALLSEAPWDAPPARFGFRRRNRIIAGLGLATLIVEAGLPSGTFSTADATLSLGKEVLVVPGSIHSPESAGSNRLLLQGAVPVVDDQSFSDCLTALVGVAPIEHTVFKQGMSDQGRNSKPEPNELLRALAAKPMTAEEVAAIKEKDIAVAIRELSNLELQGIIIRLRDGRYAISEQRRYY